MSHLPPARRRNGNAQPRASQTRGGTSRQPAGGGEVVPVSLPKGQATPENILLAIFAHYGLRSGAEVERALEDNGYWQRAIDDLVAKGIPERVARLPRGGRYEERWGVPEEIVRELRAYRQQARRAPAPAPRVETAPPLPPLFNSPFDPLLTPPGVHPNSPAGGGGPGRFRNPSPFGTHDGATTPVNERDGRGVLNELWDGVADFFDSLQCVYEAFERAKMYAPQAVLDETGYAIGELIEGLVPGLLLAGATLGGTTALGAGLGAVIGAFGGGVGAAPGAVAGGKIGFEVGVAILTWLGIGMLVVHIGSKLGEAGDAIGRGAARAWAAGGKPPDVRSREIDEAARDLARAVGILFRLILEGIVIYLTERGAQMAAARVGKLVERLKASRLGEGFAAWVERNWQRLVEDPRLNRSNKGGGSSQNQQSTQSQPPSQPAPQKPSQTPTAVPPNPPRINPQKQAGHVKGTPQYNNRVKQGKPTSAFDDTATANQLVQEAYAKGKPLPNRPEVIEYDFGRPIGTGPQGQPATKVRVHVDTKGEIHGYPKP